MATSSFSGSMSRTWVRDSTAYWRALPNNRMKLTKRPRGATVCLAGGAACAFAHRRFAAYPGVVRTTWDGTA
jgi:hypothetical protein